MKMTSIRIRRLLVLSCCLLLVCMLLLLHGWKDSEMPRGAPDYSNVTAAVPTHRVDDMAEIPARLYSPVVYDRAGKVVFLSRFGKGITQFKRTTAGTGASQVPSPDTWLGEGFCLKMTTSDTSDQVSTASVEIAITEPDTRMGLEAAFAMPNSEMAFAIQLSIYLNPDLYQYTMTYKSDISRLYITSPTGAGILDDDLQLREGATAWHKWKFVVDLEDNMYVRAMLDENRYDISDYAAYSYTTTEENRIDIRLQAWSRDDTCRTVYWDNVVVTQGEP